MRCIYLQHFIAHCPAICRLDFGKLWAAGIIFCAVFDLPHTGSIWHFQCRSKIKGTIN